MSKKNEYLDNIKLKKQSNQKTIKKYEELSNFKKASKMQSCFLAFHVENYKHKTQELIKSKSMPLATCQNKFCHICSFIKSKKTFVKTYTALEKMKASNIDFIAYHLTLTIKNPNVSNIDEHYKNMNKAFHNFIKNFDELNKYLIGWQAGREVSQSANARKNNEFHPHIHCLLLLHPSFHNVKSRNNKITESEFREKWSKCCAFYNIEAYQISFKKIKAKEDFINFYNEQKESDPFLSAIAEVAKYPAKPSDIQKMTSEHFDILDKFLFKKRMFSSGGLLKEYLKKDKEDQEILHIDNFELLNILYCQFTSKNKLKTTELTPEQKESYLFYKKQGIDLHRIKLYYNDNKSEYYKRMQRRFNIFFKDHFVYDYDDSD